MTFDINAEEIAREAMRSINPNLVEPYSLMIRFLANFPEFASAMRGKSAPKVGSRTYIERQAVLFARARQPRAPQPPSTVPDEMVSVILHEYFGLAREDLERAKQEHSLSMAAENLIGDLLERYLSTILEPRGWVWCSGATVRAIDFVRPPTKKTEDWRTLQVKNRDNSENSSSSAIRNGTTIEKWHRTFSKKKGSNWSQFPDPDLRAHLSEEAFKSYARHYLKALRL